MGLLINQSITMQSAAAAAAQASVIMATVELLENRNNAQPVLYVK